MEMDGDFFVLAGKGPEEGTEDSEGEESILV